jgi:hypothetical protein
MSPEIQTAQAKFFDAFFATKESLAQLPRHKLVDLQHEAEEIRRRPSSPFSHRAAAELIHAATTSLLEAK